MERGIPALLFYEDHVLLSPYMHSDQDVVGVSLNSDPLWLANAQAAAATLFTLARPVRPPDILLRVSRLPGDPRDTVRLEWTGGFPAWSVHRRDLPRDVADDAFVIQPGLTARAATDASAAGSLLFYSIEEFP